MNALALLLAVALLAVSIWLFFRPRRQPPEVGEIAPGFSLCDQSGQKIGLEDSAGHWRLLFFYPRDDTPGCTREACGLRDAHAELNRANAIVLGLSVDVSASHAAFAQKFALPYPLLADPDGATAAAYGSLIRLGPLRFARRRSFIVDPRGRIAARFLKVDPARHADEVLAMLRRLQSPGGQ